MKICVLLENTVRQQNLRCEHGLSLYIETGNHRILFDAGQTGYFADNAEALGVDLRKVDFAILSHGHYDHGGGLHRFLEVNATAPVYLHREAFLPHWSGTQKNIGLDSTLQHSSRLVFTDDCLKIAEGITLYSCNHRSRPFPTDNFGLRMEKDGQLQPDDFHHEQYLLIEENGKRICFSGCSHRGIQNIVHWFQPDVLIGGFHFSKLDPTGDGAVLLEEAARCLMESPTVYYTGHCTGQAQFAFLQQRMGTRLREFSTGTVISL